MCFLADQLFTFSNVDGDEYYSQTCIKRLPLMEETECPKNTTDLLQVTDKLYHQSNHLKLLIIYFCKENIFIDTVWTTFSLLCSVL